MSTKTQILIVDDEPGIANTLKESLESEGFEVKLASNGLEAKGMLTLNAFDLVVSDVKMHSMGGVELLHFVRKTYPGIPVILMTGFADFGEKKEALEIGAASFLMKPFKLATLKQEIDQVLATRPKVVKEEAPVPEKTLVDADFVAIPIENFVSGSAMRFSVYIRLSQDKFVKLAHGGERLDVSRVDQFRKKGIHHLYLEKPDFSNYVGFNVTLASAVHASPTLPQEKKVKFMANAVSVALESIYSHELNRETFEAAQGVVKLAVDVVAAKPSILELFESLQKSSNWLFAHSVGVSLFSAMIAKEMNWKSMKTEITVSIAGLMHDIGRKELPAELQDKPRMMYTAEEIQIYESHSTRGSDLLYNFPGVGEEVAQVAAQHHEYCDGTGFPAHLTKNKIIPLARLVSVANEFCNIMIKNPNSEGSAPLAAFGQLQNRFAGRLDPDFIQALQRVLASGNQKA